MLSDYVLFTDSVCDLSQTLLDEIGVNVVPLSFNIDGKDYKNYSDEREISMQKFFELIKAGKTSTTSQVVPEEFVEFFTPHLKNGKDVLYIAFSSGLSGTFASAQIAADTLKEKFPDRKIVVIDSLCASLGEGLLVFRAASEKAKGKTIDELKKFIENLIPRICHIVYADDLKQLSRGGRISASSAFLGGMLGIKPLIKMNSEGKLVLVDKARGKKKAFELLIDKIKNSERDIKTQTVFICHSNCINDVNTLSELLKSNFGVEKIIVNSVGPVIGAHIGVGIVAAFYEGSENFRK